MRFLNGFEVTRTLLIAVVMSTGLLIAIGTGLLANGTPLTKKHFEIRYPDLTTLNSGCSQDDEGPCSIEAGELAVALEALEQAKAAAEQAYEAWINCLDANGGGPNPNPGSPLANTVSILESVK